MASERHVFSSEGPQPGTVEVAHLGRAGLAVVTMHGEHDLSTIPLLQPAFEQAIAHSNVLVDLSDCAFIDCTVIALLMRAANAVQARGEQLALVIPPEQRHVSRAAAMTGLSEFFGVYSSRDTALARLRLANDRARWLKPSPAMAVDEHPSPEPEPAADDALADVLEAMRDAARERREATPDAASIDDPSGASVAQQERLAAT